MILHMLAMESDAKALENFLKVRCATIAPSLDPSKTIEYLDSLRPALTKLSYLQEYNDAEVQTDEALLAGSAQKLSEAFATLSERGIIEEFRKRAEAAVEKQLSEQEEL